MYPSGPEPLFGHRGVGQNGNSVGCLTLAQRGEKNHGQWYFRSDRKRETKDEDDAHKIRCRRHYLSVSQSQHYMKQGGRASASVPSRIDKPVEAAKNGVGETLFLPCDPMGFAERPRPKFGARYEVSKLVRRLSSRIKMVRERQLQGIHEEMDGRATADSD